VFVSEIGIKVYLKKIKFGEQRDDNLDYHLHVESQMLKMYAKLLLEMLTNREDFEDLEDLDISPDLKCILYECLHAEDKTLKREEDRYHFEIKRYIEKETNQNNKSKDYELVNELKEIVNEQKAKDNEE